MGQKPKDLDPYASVAHFLGSKIRYWRTKQAGRSLAKLAAQVQYDSTYLGRAERGEQLPTLHVVTAIDRAVGANGELIRLRETIDKGIDIRYMADGDEAKPRLHEANREVTLAGVGEAAAPWGEEAVSLPVFHDGKVIYVSVPRRALLGLGAGAALGAAAPSAALAVSPPGSGLPTSAPEGNPIEHLRQARRVFIDMDNVLGPRSVIPQVIEKINVMQEMRRIRSGGDRRALMEVLSQYAELCGWLHQDAGDLRAAQYWTDRALEWSYTSGDPDLTVYVLARKAQLATDMGDALLAIDNGAAARSMARGDTKLPAVAAVYAAHGYALQNDAAAAHRLFDQAHVHLEKDLDPGSPWGKWLDPAYIEVHRARSLSQLGQQPAAADGFRAAIEQMPPGFHRDRGVYMAREAMAHAGAGEPQEAARVGIEALAIGANTGSGRILSELAALDSELARWRTVPGVGDYHDALLQTVPHQAT